MADKKTKLELTWIGKENRPRLEPRILLEDTELSSVPFQQAAAEPALFENMLVQGDNLLALKALEQKFAGKVKCIYIDPPFNTGQAFEHYDDGVEHSIWLSLMRDRLALLSRLLRADGSIWVNCDDYEQGYLRVLMDEVFGRKCFIATVVWQSRYSRSNDASLSQSHNYILVYSPDPDAWKKVRNRLPRSEEQAKQYQNPDNDPKGRWRAIPWDAPNLRPNLTYPITTPTGRVRMPPAGRCWSRTEDQWLELVRVGLAYFGKSGDGVPSFKQYLDEAAPIVPNTWWPHEEAGHTDEAKKEIYALFGAEGAFATPKPERLLQRIVEIATNPGEIVLDSFLGSGTTAAVAHKMRRRWIGVELGEHATTVCAPRLRKVVAGDDTGGISQIVSWNGGGGFRFYRLAPSLLERDKWGNFVIAETYRKGPDAGARLAEAMCKLENFTYAPSAEHFWMHGTSSEHDFIYVTTQNLGAEQVRAISEEVRGLGEKHSLLICCGAFRCSEREFPNITLKKIPSAVLARCEWGKDDYSLNVAAVTGEEPDEPVAGGEPGAPPLPRAKGKRGRPKKPQPAQLLPLFTPKEGA